ncbi:MAG: hypothetical protein P4M07_25425 [Xanthobacteraceae bacterium]|nr:hypothetical protein [Xanthobacteraceae bacterium]
MMPGGITESIWHFAAYLHLFDDTARDRTVLDEGAYRPSIDDYLAKLPNYTVSPDEDPLAPFGVFQPGEGDLEDVRLPRVLPIKHLHPPTVPAPDTDSAHPPPIANTFPVSGAGGGGGGDSFVIQASYQPGGEQSLIEVHQINALSNDGTLVVEASPELSALLTWETGSTLDRMAAESDYAIPDQWKIPQDTAPLASFVQLYDQHLAVENGAPELHSVAPGYYLNGTLQDQPLTPPDQATLPQPEPAPNVVQSDGLGQWAYDGGNSTTNLAQIVDMTASARTMIVLGNYYSTDAIFQTNAYTNNDHVTVDGTGAIVNTGPDLAINMADFVQHPGVYADLPTYFAGPQWSVEIVNGDYYNVHSVIQTNYLSNNNITVQESADTQYVVQGGGNQLENLAQISDGAFDYDLIIVGGSFHNFNAVFQSNILLNNDVVKVSGNGTDPSQTVTVGDNQLTNMATIENYGGNSFQPYGADLANLVNEIKAGVAELDPSFGQLVAGDGGVFHVLYVTGNYYDINALWQTNIVANSNVVMQMLNPASAGAQSYYGGTESQSVTAGNNLLINDAAIIQALPTTVNINGQVYTDTILIQANLLTQQNDHVTQANPQALVPEIIAFIGTAEAPTTTAPAQPATTSPVHEDPLASLTH